MIITLKKYLDKQKCFVIPEYQRGYIWGKNRKGERNSVENILNNLLQHYANRTEIFLQGVTVTETDDKIILIDGQQRTTFFYLLLKTLGYTGCFNIRYEVREASDKFLAQWTDNEDYWKEDPKEEYQDIFFFKKTVRTIKDHIHNIDNKKDLREFLLNNIKFLYIKIPAEKATTVFSMMNGNKAVMLQEEVVKAEILRLASLNSSKSDWAQEWENNMLRSRYAREWDRWLHWWGRDDVQQMFGTNRPLGLLLSSFAHMQKHKEFTFEAFKTKFLPNSSILEAKRLFDGLRRLQKKFEDSYNDPEKYNMIGAILSIFDAENRYKFINYYFVDNKHDAEKVELANYYLLAFIGMTHDEITKKNEEKFSEKFKQSLEWLSDDMLYMIDECKEFAFRLLLRLNIDQDIRQCRKFNFDIWNKNVRSLEHIHPKSKVAHKGEDDKMYNGNDDIINDSCLDNYLKREDIVTEDGSTRTTEHSIGNLVLLYKNENSQFNDKDFVNKKRMFFNPNRKELFKSRHLLHTICVFAEKDKWNGQSIAQNKCEIIEQFNNDYDELKKFFNYE